MFKNTQCCLSHLPSCAYGLRHGLMTLNLTQLLTYLLTYKMSAEHTIAKTVQLAVTRNFLLPNMANTSQNKNRSIQGWKKQVLGKMFSSF